MRALLVFAKAPLAGVAKTRLVGDGIDAAAAAGFAEAFLRDTLDGARRTCAERLRVHVAPPSELGAFARLGLDPAEIVAQVEGDLGTRLRGAFDRELSGGATSAVAIGADTPHLDPRTIDEAFERLGNGASGVVGPAADGGYFLIGLARAAWPRGEALFRDVEWSTSRVLAQTHERARRAEIELATLPEGFDVDTRADLERLREVLAADPARAPRTWRRLAEIGATRPSRRS